MERRYKLFADHQVRNLVGYNDLMRAERQGRAGRGGTPEQYQVLPQIVIVIDELADLMMVAAKEVETSICRIAQKRVRPVCIWSLPPSVLRLTLSPVS